MLIAATRSEYQTRLYYSNILSLLALYFSLPLFTFVQALPQVRAKHSSVCFALLCNLATRNAVFDARLGLSLLLFFAALLALGSWRVCELEKFPRFRGKGGRQAAEPALVYRAMDARK